MADANAKKLDVNKENKSPGSPGKREDSADRLSDLPLSLSDPELEEGEILSESDETAVAASPVSVTKRVKLTTRKKPNLMSVLKKKAAERSRDKSETASGSSQSPASRSRFKTVCPASTKAAFSTVEEVMETFKLVRSELRKKYMKLHKSFPRKSFYGVMENFQESFFEFVEGAHFGQICSQTEELKSKLKTLISSVFSKVSNNGIVKRIFEQQAVDLKQKLWDFVDVQVEYLFRDIHLTLQSLCKHAGAPPEDKKCRGSEKVSRKKTLSPRKESKPDQRVEHTRKCAVVPYKTGLGSRGKDIRISPLEKDKSPEPRLPKAPTVMDLFSPKKSSPSKKDIGSLFVSQNSSLLDKADFELLTEQQASSLTFNLVRDSQMGEIFKCLLQGSDLLESGAIAGENTSWSLVTPKKDGERLIGLTTPTKFDSPSKLLSPTKFETPSKLIATWSSISPRTVSPRAKDASRLNPALLDESCLLELPSDSRATLSAQRTYSILAEDLAVSLTIPSPLKSDSHLSFLQPTSAHVVSTPDSVISAHISEDALLDGEDASEQDIHLALDTDNSSLDSSSSTAAANKSFVFKPDLPVQALVMERSNDHFILKIRQASTEADVTLLADETLTEDAAALESPTEHVLKSPKDSNPGSPGPSEDLRENGSQKSKQPSSSRVLVFETQDNTVASRHCRAAKTKAPESPRNDTSSEKSLVMVDDVTPEKNKRRREIGQKRKKQHDKSKAKRRRKEGGDGDVEEMACDDKREDDEARSSPSSLSPNSLSARNVVKKKGSVVMAWTRSVAQRSPCLLFVLNGFIVSITDIILFYAENTQTTSCKLNHSIFVFVLA